MNTNRFPGLARFLPLMICALTSSFAEVSEIGASGPAVFSLGQTLFVSEKVDAARDHDLDWLKDDLELKIADNFKPFLIFDSAENSRRPNEPITLFQVRPIECV